MKAVMYHYVRPGPLGLHRLKFLHLDNFRRQLDWLAEHVGFVDRAAFWRSLDDKVPVPGCVLTFDDGFSDHYEYVLPELQGRGLWGVFYVSTAPYLTGALLDVHRLHVMLATHGGHRALQAMRAITSNDMLTDRGVQAFRENTYRVHDDDAATLEFKRSLNYYVSYGVRSAVIDRLWQDLGGAETAASFYASLDQIRDLHRCGMLIGSHTVNHPVMSKLPPEAQKREIDQSFAFLSDAIGDRIETFCYPYGGFHSFGPETEDLLKGAGCRFAFNVEQRDIETSDLARRFALPRYDCNQLPFGAAG